MNNLLPTALTNTILLAEHDEATQRAVVDAVEKIVVHYLQRNSYQISSLFVSEQQTQIERLALRALKNHFTNASNIY